MLINRFHICALLAAFICAPAAFAQQAGGAGQGAGASTTDGTSGTTTQGFGASAAGGVPTDTPVDFVGGNTLDSFVGGLLETERVNRQFQGLNQTSTVPSGGNRATGGTARVKRTAMRISFAYPQANLQPVRIRRRDAVFSQMAIARPQLRSIGFQITPQGTGIVTGSAPDAATRRLAANLLRLEPGVRRVENQTAIQTFR